MSMNATQRKHILTRLNEIVRKKCNVLETKLDKERAEAAKKRPKLTAKVLIDGIKKGTIKLVKNCSMGQEIDDCTYIEDIFDISKWDDASLDDRIYEKVDAYKEKLMEEVNRIEDELVLGDVDNALAMIKNFEKFANGVK